MNIELIVAAKQYIAEVDRLCGSTCNGVDCEIPACAERLNLLAAIERAEKKDKEV